MTYIPSERVLKEGGYEGEESMWVYGHHGTWTPGIEEKIVNEVMRQVKLIRNGVSKFSGIFERILSVAAKS